MNECLKIYLILKTEIMEFFYMMVTIKYIKELGNIEKDMTYILALNY